METTMTTILTAVERPEEVLAKGLAVGVDDAAGEVAVAAETWKSAV